VVSVLDAIEGDTPVEFGEGDNKKRTADVLREFLKSLPEHSLTGRHLATRDKGAAAGQTDPMDLANRAVEFQEEQRAKGIVITSAEAVNLLSGEQA
jgi:hypothetical protein